MKWKHLQHTFHMFKLIKRVLCYMWISPFRWRYHFNLGDDIEISLMPKNLPFQFILGRSTTRWQFCGAALMVLSILLAKAGDLNSESQTVPPTAILIAAFASVNSGAPISPYLWIGFLLYNEIPSSWTFVYFSSISLYRIALFSKVVSVQR